jgi:hypothetical protein
LQIGLTAKAAASAPWLVRLAILAFTAVIFALSVRCAGFFQKPRSNAAVQ